ncbi:MAG: hypothetical protein ACPGVP_08970 [Thiolinea sp.]
MKKNTLFPGKTALLFPLLLISPLLMADVNGTDANNPDNPVVQPQPDAQSGGGRDQSQQFGDVLHGSDGNDFIVGKLGIDIMFAGPGDDILVGGTEDFNPLNRDRAFGEAGNDVFLWAPGDGSDYFNGGHGDSDVLMFGPLGEKAAGSAAPVFAVQTDQNFDPLFRDPISNLPAMNVTGSPGFCEVIDASTSEAAANTLSELGLDHLIRFIIRGVADSFAAGGQSDDNGVRVTIHTKDVEYLVCTSRSGGQVEVLNLTTTPPTAATISDLPAFVQAIIR